MKVKDSDSLYKAMKYSLKLMPRKREAMGQAGRRKMEQELKKEIVVTDTIRALGHEKD